MRNLAIAGQVAVALAIMAMGCSLRCPRNRDTDPVYRPRIIDRAPHDRHAFTQGLLIDGDTWLESTGQYGRSDLREVDRKTGQLLRRVALPKRFFGEGLALLDGLLYQLTWKEGTCFVYDRETFRRIAQFPYAGEGWGLATDGRYLFMSDGSATIRVMDPASFREIRRFAVRGAAGAVERLNELEWIEGEIWANVFLSKWIVRFCPRNGRVIGFVDLHHLPLPADVHPDQDVLNGIAFDSNDGSIWVTGKNWKQLYRIEWPPPSP